MCGPTPGQPPAPCSTYDGASLRYIAWLVRFPAGCHCILAVRRPLFEDRAKHSCTKSSAPEARYDEATVAGKDDANWPYHFLCVASGGNSAFPSRFPVFYGLFDGLCNSDATTCGRSAVGIAVCLRKWLGGSRCFGCMFIGLRGLELARPSGSQPTSCLGSMFSSAADFDSWRGGRLWWDGLLRCWFVACVVSFLCCFWRHSSRMRSSSTKLTLVSDMARWLFSLHVVEKTASSTWSAAIRPIENSPCGSSVSTWVAAVPMNDCVCRGWQKYHHPLRKPRLSSSVHFSILPRLRRYLTSSSRNGSTINRNARETVIEFTTWPDRRSPSLFPQGPLAP